jgi:hypothetical protein
MYLAGRYYNADMRVLPLKIMGLLLAGLLLGGCVQREITITSEPSGALVHLNDREVGRTPVDVPFTFYGTYDVRLERSGYEPLWTRQQAKAPWWDYPGPDLLAEAVPGLKSNPTWHFQLEPALPPNEQDPDALLNRAEELKDHLENDEQ